MRINTAMLDPTSPLAARISAALARDAAQRVRLPTAASPSRLVPETWRREEDLHRAIVAMLAVEMRVGVVFFHPANGGRRGKAEAGRLKGMGVVAGVPDLIVIVASRAHGLEIKTDAGRLSAAQKVMAERFRRAGCDFEVARSVTGARQILARWGAIEGNSS